MDCLNSITIKQERKRGQHLQREDRGALQRLLHRMGYSLRKIAKEVNCSPSTVLYELRRGTAPRKSGKGRPPSYCAKRGQAVYKTNRLHSRKPYQINFCGKFIAWVCKQVLEAHWSLDACTGYAKLNKLFAPNEMVSTKTLYNALEAGRLPLTVFDVPCVLTRRHKKKWHRVNKRLKGRSVEERPAVVDERSEIGRWEADTVVGRRNGKEAVVFSLLERVTDNYLSIRIEGKTSNAVDKAMEQLHAEYGDNFSKVFKTITTDNGSEFETFSKAKTWGTRIYFTHPYSSWERAQNERHNGLLRAFVPKGASIEAFSPEQILSFGDTLNSRPRKRLCYHTPEELFEAFLDEVYAN